MKKRDLLFAGLLLAAVPVFAQEYKTEPTRTDKDAKVIFVQDFEADWETWSNQVVDQITELEYYNTDATGSASGKKIWPGGADHATWDWNNVIVRTDSVLDLKNGVMTTDNASEVEMYSKDEYTILQETSVERAEAMSLFGEDGGDYVFQYVSDSIEINNWGNVQHYSPNYRRNLFVRGLPIEEESSYRLTFFVKTEATHAHQDAYEPRLYADVMRGYFHAEKPFSMGLENDADHYKYNSTFEYEKTEFKNKEWEKVTFMTYYLNDSIANAFVFVNGYWWDSDWTWTKYSATPVPADHNLIYTVQPDKFFVRISFSSNNTKFQIDNISLTKSWIGGCEYSDDKLRVDFGYQTNVKELAQAAYAENKIAQKEVVAEVAPDKVEELGYEYYFEVWGKDIDTHEWFEIPIRSAEYHDDGYMYMFTDFYQLEEGGEWYPYLFDNFDTVLVTFHNPVDQPDLCLKYTGSKFPMALDTTWIKNGKIVPDFYNEIAQANPNVFTGVHSLKDLPPVMQIAPYEEGSFGLEPKDHFTFKFSREVLVDNLGDKSEKAIGYVNGAVWTPTFNEETNELTITCPDDSWKDLSGDVEIKLIQLYGKGTAKGENVVMHYAFGAFDRTPDLFSTQTDWKSEVTGTSRPYPTSVYVHSATDPFKQGDGANSPGKCGLYNMNGEGLYNCGFYLSCREDGATGNLYSIETLAAGDYTISFKACGWGSNSIKLVLKLYPAPEAELLDGNDKGFAILEAVPDKAEIGKVTEWGANISAGGDWPEKSTDITWSFTIPEAGDYVFEFFTDGSTNYKGVFFSNYIIKAHSDLSCTYTVALNEAVEAANARLELAEVDLDLYGGSIYDALKAKIEYYEAGGAFDALKLTSPSDWSAAAKDMNDATNTMKLRMDTVKKFVETSDKIVSKLAEDVDYSGLAAYAALVDLNDEALEYPVTTKSGVEIYEFNKKIEDAISALDARVAVNKAFEDAVAAAKSLIEEAEKPEYDEYLALEECYATYNELDIITPEDAATITDATAALTDASNAYKSRVAGASVLPIRVNALYDLAKKLHSDIAENGVLTERLEATDFDDDDLAEIYKTAIKIAIYEMADDMDPSLDSLDITPFIKNYHLYQTAKIVDRSDKNMPDNNKAGADPNGAQMQYTQHKWNSGDLNGKMPIWVMITEVEYTDLYPGWTVKAFNSGNSMVTGDQSYNNYKNGITIFDAEIGMDWNGKAELKQEVADLPVGIYTLGVNLPEYTAVGNNGDKNNPKVSTLSVTVNEETLSGEAREDGATAITIDSVVVAEGDTLAIDFVLQSQNGWSRADNFFLSFYPDENYDYGEAIDALEADLEELMTVVDARKAVQAGVEYYTISGIKLDAPKAGQILIRKTTQSNGKVVMDKVLIK